MEFTLSELAKKHHYKVESYGSVDSTNRVALAKADSGEDRLWIVANEQTSGRARRGRQWVSPKGNLYASLLLTQGINPEKAAQLGFVAGVSLAEAVNTIFRNQGNEQDSVRLKWPNDMLLNGAKASGILLELEKLGNGTSALVIGIGVNVSQRYEQAPYPTQSIRNLGIAVDNVHVFTSLTQFWALNYELFLSDNGSDMIRTKWLDYAAYLGETLTVTNNNKQIQGIFSGLDENFNCLVTLGNGEETKISAGDVHFGTVASGWAGQ
ncbi:biotin--[acetyl-CoA-carboxylase] ligase [uncultured Bartonella sp.]|uniref:biotin--[acetyl-CoA-carboxylase] ligase n=1 Tax=uncultured Bartonella sp. TaxID=104108 RepID=UPI002603099F|nr:biotin--[acetyl-CoA-carboxylase] ligase [uncultured Bartonella sp.]